MRTSRFPVITVLVAAIVAVAFSGVATGATQTARGTDTAGWALLPMLPPSWGGITAFVAGALLTLTLGGARIRRDAIASRSNTTYTLLVTDIVIVCLLGIIVGIALPSGWRILSGSLGRALVAGAITLGIAFVAHVVTVALITGWLGTDAKDVGEDVDVLEFLASLLVLPVAAEVLSSLTGADASTYVGGILTGSVIVVGWGLIAWIRRKVSERTGVSERDFFGTFRGSLSGTPSDVRSAGSIINAVLGYPYRRYRSRREERRTETAERIEAAEAAIDRVDGPAEAATGTVRDAQDRLEAGDHDRARELAAEAEELAEWERDLVERIDAVRNRDIEGPEYAPDRVEDRLEEATEHLFAGDLVDAETSIEEAERLNGPEVIYLMDEARTTADDARRIGDDPEREIAAWERALDRYETALDRARELDERDLASDIEESVTNITERLEARREERNRARLRDAATAAWDAVREADEIVDDDPEAAREAYDRAVEHYTDALDIAQSAGHDRDLRERIEAAIDCLGDVHADCRLLVARNRLREALSYLDDRDRASEQLDGILDDLDDLDVETGKLPEIARRGRARLELDRIRNRIATVESEFEGENYYDASESLSAIREEIEAAEKTVNDCDSRKARTELDRLATRCREHADAIDRTLTDVDELPSIDPVSGIDTTFDVSPEDVPSGDTPGGHLPASETLWESVAPDRVGERVALEALAETLREADRSGYVDAEIRDRIERQSRRIEECDPILGVYDLDRVADELRRAAIDAVADLESQLADAAETLEAAELPRDYDDRPAAVDESFAEALRERDSISAFERRWSEAVDRLRDAIEAVNETVTVVDTYEEVVDEIEASLAESGEITGDDIPVRRPEEIMRIYVHRRSGVTYDPETPALRRTSECDDI